METKIIPVRWTKKNMKLFEVLGFVDRRDGKVKKLDNMTFNKFINKAIDTNFYIGSELNQAKIQKKVKVLLLDELYSERDKILEEISKIALGGNR